MWVSREEQQLETQYNGIFKWFWWCHLVIKIYSVRDGYKNVHTYIKIRARQLSKAEKKIFFNKCLRVCIVYNRKAHIDTTIKLEREVSTSHARIQSSVRAPVCVRVKFTFRSKCNWKLYYLNQCTHPRILNLFRTKREKMLKTETLTHFEKSMLDASRTAKKKICKKHWNYRLIFLPVE